MFDFYAYGFKYMIFMISSENINSSRASPAGGRMRAYGKREKR